MSPPGADGPLPDLQADSPEGSCSDVDSNVKLRQITGTTVRLRNRGAGTDCVIGLGLRNGSVETFCDFGCISAGIFISPEIA